MAARESLLPQYNALVAEGQQLTASGNLQQGGEAYRKAADVFAGTRDSDELESRFRALAEVGNGLRRAGRSKEAEAAYESMANLALQEGGPQFVPGLLAHYYIGILRTDRGDYPGAVTALRTAYDGYSKLTGVEEVTRAVGAALGLACLRVHDYSQVVQVLQSLVPKLKSDQTSATILHNLGLAQVYGGNPATAIKSAESAAAIHAQLEGENHPNTVESRMLQALALIDAGRRDEGLTLLRQSAGFILGGPGEGHPFFARALLTAARAMAHSGDGVGAEGLARRAMFIVNQANVEAEVKERFESDAAAISPLWRTLKPATAPTEVRLWRMDLQHTLRKYQPATLDFSPAHNPPKRWYFFVPAHLSPQDHAAVQQLTKIVFAGANSWLNSREPADPNVLDATEVQATEPTVAELLAASPQDYFPERVWEAATNYSVVEGTVCLPLVPQNFAEAFLAYIAVRGGTPNVEAWVSLGLDRSAIDAALANPAKTLGEKLWQIPFTPAASPTPTTPAAGATPPALPNQPSHTPPPLASSPSEHPTTTAPGSQKAKGETGKIVAIIAVVLIIIAVAVVVIHG